MADMTVEERVQDFVNKVRNKGGKLSDYFCGMTNNVARRAKEHGNVSVVSHTKCHDKEVARDLMRQLQDAGFDVDPDILSGQDDSVNVYLYKKTSLSKEVLSGSVTLEFQQSWYNEECFSYLPDTNGIYCCFVCDKKLVNNRFQNSKPIYVGMTTDGFKNRISKHQSEDHPNWKKRQKVGDDKQLVYAIAEFDNDILQSVEAALIYGNQTPENSEYIGGYQGEYHTMEVICIGAHDGLKSAKVTYKG